MTVLRRSCLRAPTVLVLAVFGMLASAPVLADEVVSFREDIQPIIQSRCLECHQPKGEGYEKSGLDLRTYEGLMKGTKFGTMVIPGDAFMSNLMVLIDGRAAPEIRMPHGRKSLSRHDRDLFRQWINQGALNN